MHKPSNTLQQVKEWLEKRSRYPHETMKKWDALYYIQQLEARLAQVERERDAMHRDMKLYSRCKACKKFADGQDCPVHTEYTYGGKALFEWRGVCEENTKEDKNG